MVACYLYSWYIHDYSAQCHKLSSYRNLNVDLDPYKQARGDTAAKTPCDDMKKKQNKMG